MRGKRHLYDIYIYIYTYIMAIKTPPPIRPAFSLIFVLTPTWPVSLLTRGMIKLKTTHSALGRVCCNLQFYRVWGYIVNVMTMTKTISCHHAASCCVMCCSSRTLIIMTALLFCLGRGTIVRFLTMREMCSFLYAACCCMTEDSTCFTFA